MPPGIQADVVSFALTAVGGVETRRSWSDLKKLSRSKGGFASTEAAFLGVSSFVFPGFAPVRLRFPSLGHIW